jgi:hypothetical protein
MKDTLKCNFFGGHPWLSQAMTAITPLYWVVEELPLVLAMFVNIYN